MAVLDVVLVDSILQALTQPVNYGDNEMNVPVPNANHSDALAKMTTILKFDVLKRHICAWHTTNKSRAVRYTTVVPDVLAGHNSKFCRHICSQ